VARIEQDNLSSGKNVGGGVAEYRIDWGPGYRVYFGCDGQTIVILLGGGTKKRQQRDIAAAQASWADYKRRKAEKR
jgi:putative addiction module killer protein